MARPARLTIAALALAVALGHVLLLEGIARQLAGISALPAMAPVLFTRTLQPAEPAPVAAAPAPAARPQPRAAPRPRPSASSARQQREQREQDARDEAIARQRAEKARQELQAERDRLAAQAQAAQQAASAAQPAASQAQAASLDRWPTDTRLTYRLSGQFRGPLYGDARVQWQREGNRYQVRLDVHVQLFGTQVLTSQGEVTPDGLLPRAYEELGPRKRRSAQLGDEVVMLENGSTLPRPAGVQDTASQFVELSQRFATGKDPLEVGRSVDVWLARPGGLDLWTYDIVDRETLRTPQLGAVEAFHLKPRAIAHPRGNISAEMWFAPSLQYLPVRIKVMMGSDVYLDLLVDRIEQR